MLINCFLLQRPVLKNDNMKLNQIQIHLFFMTHFPPASRAHPPPHGPHWGLPQSWAPPDVNRGSAHGVQTGQDSEKVCGLVSEYQPPSCEKFDGNIHERGAPQRQEAYYNENNDLQWLLLALSVRTWGVPLQLILSYDIKFDGHDHFGDHYKL